MVVGQLTVMRLSLLGVENTHIMRTRRFLHSLNAMFLWGQFSDYNQIIIRLFSLCAFSTLYKFYKKKIIIRKKKKGKQEKSI